MNRELSQKFSEAIEEVAREYAKEIGFDMLTEPHALIRMMEAVLSSKELRAKAVEVLKAKVESNDK
ncbi:MAG: hypothetical protein ACW99G_01555 [Candidatus Thorarchaeota archaeon]